MRYCSLERKVGLSVGFPFHLRPKVAITPCWRLTCVEVDEVTLGKRAAAADSGDRVVWDNFLGMMERGNSKSLVVIRLPTRSTTKRSPGPGPITRKMWKPIAQRWVKDRRILLHSDSAKAYNLKVPGMVHTKVIHQKKKVGDKWVKPRYVEIENVTTDDGDTIVLKKGTQYIDGWWRLLRKEVRRTMPPSGSAHMNAVVKFAQWKTWHQSEDLWVALGRVLRWHYA